MKDKVVKGPQNDIPERDKSGSVISPDAQEAVNNPLIFTKKMADKMRHTHDWTFVKEEGEYYDFMLTATYSRYVCPCGGMKRVRQFEVEE